MGKSIDAECFQVFLLSDAIELDVLVARVKKYSKCFLFEIIFRMESIEILRKSSSQKAFFGWYFNILRVAPILYKMFYLYFSQTSPDTCILSSISVCGHL